VSKPSRKDGKKDTKPVFYQDMKKEMSEQRDKQHGTLQGSFSAQSRCGSTCLVCKKVGHRAAECKQVLNQKTAEDRMKLL
jgi:hypothetical protein